jgi:hypothetical protein
MGQRPAKSGEQLLALMAAQHPVVRQSHLARALGRTTTTVGRYFKQLDDGTIDDQVWAQMADILTHRFDIDAPSVRPVRATAMTVDTSLTPYLDKFEAKEHLEALIKILESPDQPARDLLVVLARDRLARR